jgi:coatomer protein complex subunit epsilon
MAAGNEEAQAAIISEIQSLLASSDSNPSAQLFAAQVFLKHGLTKDALQCVHLGTVLEHNALALQIYLKLDRLDLAQQALGILKAADEESVLTSLASAHIALAGGSSTAGDALHYLNALSEQYGPSPLLLILSACANILVGEYSEAETKLLEGKKEFGNNADLLINLIVASQYLDKSSDEYVQELRESFPHCHFLQALDRVDGAYSREAVKYKVAA